MTDDARTTKQHEASLTLEEGKYEFCRSETGNLRCKLYGESWREFIGDKAVAALFDFAMQMVTRPAPSGDVDATPRSDNASMSAQRALELSENPPTKFANYHAWVRTDIARQIERDLNALRKRFAEACAEITRLSGSAVPSARQATPLEQDIAKHAHRPIAPAADLAAAADREGQVVERLLNNDYHGAYATVAQSSTAHEPLPDWVDHELLGLESGDYNEDQTWAISVAALRVLVERAARVPSSTEAIPANWREVIKKLRLGLGAGGKDAGLYMEIGLGSIILDRIEEALGDLESAPVAPSATKETPHG